MKKLFIAIIIIFLSVESKSQVYIGAGLGASVTKARFTADLAVGKIFENNWVVQGGFQAHIDPANPAILELQGGKILKTSSWRNDGIQIAGGICYHYVSSDRKSENEANYIVSVYILKDKGTKGQAQIYYGGSFTPGYLIATLGVRGIFRK